MVQTVVGMTTLFSVVVIGIVVRDSPSNEFPINLRPSLRLVMKKNIVRSLLVVYPLRSRPRPSVLGLTAKLSSLRQVLF